jgi:hypothetical protein
VLHCSPERSRICIFNLTECMTIVTKAVTVLLNSVTVCVYVWTQGLTLDSDHGLRIGDPISLSSPLQSLFYLTPFIPKVKTLQSLLDSDIQTVGNFGQLLSLPVPLKLPTSSPNQLLRTGRGTSKWLPQSPVCPSCLQVRLLCGSPWEIQQANRKVQQLPWDQAQ